MKITSKQAEKHVELLDVGIRGCSTEVSYDEGYTINLKLGVTHEQLVEFQRNIVGSDLDLILHSPAKKGVALKWDGTHQGLKQITKELGVGFLMGLDEKTDEVVYFLATGDKPKVAKEDFVTRFADGKFAVLTHSDITVNYIIGG